MVSTIVLGDGPMGRALATQAAEAAETPRLIGRSGPAGHPPTLFDGVELAYEFSRGPQVCANVAAALHGGVRALVIGTTDWEADRQRVEELLVAYGAAAVAAANFSLGVALLGRLVESAARFLGPLEAYDPFIVEWHRRGKVDRPSGTAKELARRLLAAHPRKRCLAAVDRAGPAASDELELTVVRAGAAPGMHLVGFDAPGETLELRLTARDRSAYAAGALAAGAWLLARPRPAGLHPLEAVLDDLVAAVA